MSILRKKTGCATSELDRLTTISQKVNPKDNPNMSRRRFLTLFSAGVIATGLFGAKAFSEEKPTTVASAGTVGAPSEKKVQPAGDKNILGYTLSVNAPANCFVGDAILVSVTNSKGEIVKGEKVEITEPSGNKFTISIDNSQNGFVARKAGVYTVKYGSNTYTVTVREMDAEIAKLQTVSADEIRGLVEKTENLYSYTIKRNTLNILDANGEHIFSVDISRFKKLKLKLDGVLLENLRLGAETGFDKEDGQYVQIFVVAVDSEGSIKTNMLMGALLIRDSGDAPYGFGLALLK